MTGQLPGESSKTARCRACAHAIAEGAIRCDRCGAMQRDVACPHCGAVAGISPHPKLRFVCDVCGAPRVPIVDASIKSRGRELGPLKRAEAARRSRAGLVAISIASGLLFAFSSAIAASVTALFGPGLLLAILSLAICGTLLALTTWAALRAKARGREIEPLLDTAWLAIATDVAQQSRGPILASDLANALSIDEPRAEQLLALLDVNDIVKSDITDDGEIAYSSRLRIAPQATEVAHEQAAEEEAAAEVIATVKSMSADKREPK